MGKDEFKQTVLPLLYNRVVELSDERGESPTKSCRLSGAGEDLLQSMTRSIPQINKVYLLAKYFDVSIDYLVGLTDTAQVQLPQLPNRSPMTVIDNIISILRARGITQAELSAATGISTGNISDWKAGRSTPKLEAISKIADYLGVSVDYLLGRTDERSDFMKGQQNEKLISRVKELARQIGSPPTCVCVDAGVGKDFLGNAKKSDPGISKITALADYLGVSVDYLLGRTDIPQMAHLAEASSLPPLPNPPPMKNSTSINCVCQEVIRVFYERLKRICSEKGIKVTNLVADLGMSRGNHTSWRSGNIPKADTLCNIADRLGVSVDYLLGRTDEMTPATGEPLGPDELEVLTVYRSLNPVGQHELRTLAQFVAGQDRYKKEAAGGPSVALKA